jgi:hypothetical protein
MSDFGPDHSGGLRRFFDIDIKNAFESISTLQGQVAALTAYVSRLGSSAKDEDIVAIKGAAQESLRYLSTPFGISPPARHASAYVDHIHAMATGRVAGNEGPHG